VVSSRYATLKSLLDMGGGGELLVVDQALKDVIERLDPGVHQFRPVRLTGELGDEIPRPFYTLLIGQFLESFSPEKSVPGSFKSEFSTFNNHQRYRSTIVTERSKGLAFSRAAFGGRHLWREKYLTTPRVICSDEFRAAVKAAKLKIPSFFQMTEVA
jgi:hypothetical protein